ncbi:unnamed protein product [Calypogeia fissa]
MLPMRDLFYGKAEPVWILNHAKNDEDEEEHEEAEEEESSSTREYEKYEYSTSTVTPEVEKQYYPTVTTSPYYPYYSPYVFNPYYGIPPHNHGYAKKEAEKVVMKIPICCSECEESIKVPLNGMKGVKSVDCNIRRQKVTVVVTSAAPADILMECRKVFKESRMWNEDED